MTSHIMLDLETMGNGSYAAIISIGAVKFDPARGEGVESTFHQAVRLASSLRAGMRVDADTIEWWLKPAREDARRSMLGLPAVDLDEALLGFSEWYGTDDRVPVWGNGASFDNVILANAYKAVGLDKPWGYRSDRCFRTIRALAPEVERPVYGVAHNAVDDAVAQATWLQKIVAVKGWTL